LYVGLVGKSFGSHAAYGLSGRVIIPAEDGVRQLVVADGRACISVMVEGERGCLDLSGSSEKPLVHPRVPHA
jgi:hypothetical protein